jgi:carboxymethylenebutenolidase
MGRLIEFGDGASGYLAVPAAGSGPGVVVIQEWWGLNDQIEEVCDALAARGLVALAPDLYRGVEATEPDEAAKLMMALNLERAAADMGGAIDALLARPEVSGSKVGVIGFCMGGGLTLLLATQRPDAVGAAVPFYGVIPWAAHQPDWTRLEAAVQGHYAELDDSASPAMVAELSSTLEGLGKRAEFFVYAGAQHAFTNDHRREVYDAAATELAMDRAVTFLHAELG